MISPLFSSKAAMQEAFDLSKQSEDGAADVVPADEIQPVAGNDRQVLYIAGQTYGSNMNPAFEEAYPDVDIRIMDEFGNTANKLFLDMTTQEGAADIYIVYVYSGLLEATIKKGIAYDLSNSPILSDFASKMAPFIKDKVYDGEGIFAIPYDFSGGQLFAFNKKVGQELNIDQPRSLIELAEIYATWAERDDINDYYLTSRPMWSPVRSFLIYGINAYIAENSKGDYISFDTKEFRDYIHSIEKLRGSFSYLSEEHSGWKEHMKDKCLFVEDYPLLRRQDDDGINLPELKTFALPMYEGGTPVVPVSMSIFIVNAASKRRELAVKYLEYLAENYPPEQRILIDDSFKEPVEFENYRENLASYQKEMEELTKLLEDPANKDDVIQLREQIKETQFILDEIESTRWTITEDDILGYESTKPYIRIMPRISYDYYATIPSMNMLFLGFVNGELDADMFLDQLSQVQRLINLESE